MGINGINNGCQYRPIDMSDGKKAESNNRFVDKLKNACTKILNKLSFSKAKSLSNIQVSAPELRSVSVRLSAEKNVEFDAASINIERL